MESSGVHNHTSAALALAEASAACLTDDNAPLGDMRLWFPRSQDSLPTVLIIWVKSEGTNTSCSLAQLQTDYANCKRAVDR